MRQIGSAASVILAQREGKADLKPAAEAVATLRVGTPATGLTTRLAAFEAALKTAGLLAPPRPKPVAPPEPAPPPAPPGPATAPSKGPAGAPATPAPAPARAPTAANK